MMTCYDDVMRTIIELPEDQLEALDALCRRDSISRAEAIRRAVGALIRSRPAPERERAFGLWRGRGEDGLAYQRRARREWAASAPRR
jgi:ribbon-helix-helix CopG family protein